jgi:acetyl-CoA C-acetyltransferase
VDPRTPVIVGVGQHTWRDPAPTSPRELMRLAVESAVTDTGATGVLRRIQSLGVVDSFSWGTADPATLLAADLGISPAETVYTHTSGTSPLDLLSDAAGRISEGNLDAALITGGEAVRALFGGRYGGGPKQPEGTAPTRMLGIDREPQHAAETAAQLLIPIAFYPLFENAIRAEAGAGTIEHLDWLGELWAGFAEVAASNPHAVMGEQPSARDIVTAGPRNRMAAAPYRKLMTANIFVDQAAALVVCSAEVAQAAGVPRSNWVFVHATAAANDHWFPSQRPDLHRSPAIAAVGQSVLGHTGLGIGDIAHLDLYSCFPSAVQVAATELGLSRGDLTDDSRPPTVTGGLTFGGGPGSNYVTHSVATLATRLRVEPDQHALATAVGWYLTKHAAVVLSGRPPATPYAHHDHSADVALLPTREITSGASGAATIETYTVVFARSREPERGIVVCGLPDGTRAVAASESPESIAALLDTDPLGTKVELTPPAGFRIPG